MSSSTNKYPVAYFSAEYGLAADLPIYAGGLGILSGDTFKQAADDNMNFVAVGLLYRGVNYIQSLDENLIQQDGKYEYDPVEAGFEHVYSIENQDQPLFIKISLAEEDIWAKVWKKTMNQAVLYLLDTETEQNSVANREITHALYFGSDEIIIKQQLVLGIGGFKLLNALNITPDLYHLNEGRPAFLYWELVRHLMSQDHLDYQQAQAVAKKKLVYTNHTLVRAGNQAYNTELLKSYIGNYAEYFKVKPEDMLALGNDETQQGQFSMTEFALNISHKASSVSQPHYELSRNLWPEFNWVNVTNGVHMPTWQDSKVVENQADPSKLWQTHLDNKKALSDYIVEQTGFGYDPNRLVIGWARRIATYKRPGALFEDMERLKQILSNQDRPVQILMSGKAHASDMSAKKLLAEIIEHMSKLNGHAIFVPNYNIDVAWHMVRGVDVWLNTPIMGKEASGTSGMKAIANGVLQLTVEDGWAAEVDWHDLGFTLDATHLAETLYFRLEQDIIPQYYTRNQDGIPEDWVAKMQKSIELAKKYSAERMLNEYKTKLYNLNP